MSEGTLIFLALWSILGRFQSLFLLDERRYYKVNHVLAYTLIVSILVFIGWAKVLIEKQNDYLFVLSFQSLFLLDERRYSRGKISDVIGSIGFNPCFYWMSEGTPCIYLNTHNTKKVSILVFIGWAKVHLKGILSRIANFVSILVFIGWAKVRVSGCALYLWALVVSILVFIGWAKVQLRFSWMPGKRNLVSILVFIGWAKVREDSIIVDEKLIEFQSLFLLDERRYWTDICSNAIS